MNRPDTPPPPHPPTRCPTNVTSVAKWLSDRRPPAREPLVQKSRAAKYSSIGTSCLAGTISQVRVSTYCILQVLYFATGDVAVSTVAPLQGLMRRWRGVLGGRASQCVDFLRGNAVLVRISSPPLRATSGCNTPLGHRGAWSDGRYTRPSNGKGPNLRAMRRV